MGNLVRLESAGYIYQELKKDMTAQDLRDDLLVIRKLETELVSQGKKVHILVNANGMSKATTEMRQIGVENLKQMRYERLAVAGLPNQYMAKMVNFVLIASGKSGNIKVFPSVDLAQEWLKQ